MTRGIMVTMLVVLAVVVSAGGGCDLTSAERVDLLEKAIGVAESKRADIDSGLTEIELVIAGILAELEKSGLDPAKTAGLREDLAAAYTVVVEFKASKDKIIISLGSWREEIERIKAGGEVDWLAELQVLGAGAKTAAPYVPEPVKTGLMLFSLVTAGIGGVYGALKKKKANLAEFDRLVAQKGQERAIRDRDLLEANLGDVVGSVNVLLDTFPDQVKEGSSELNRKAAGKLLAANQKLPGTRQAVRTLK